MNHSRKLNNIINRIHEKALRVVYNDHKSTFEELLQKNDSVTIKVPNIRALSIEMFSVKTGKAPKIMNDVFTYTSGSKYFLRGNKDFRSSRIRTENYGTSSLTFLGPKLWSQLPGKITESKTTLEFKNKIKLGSLRLSYVKHIPQVGYI